MADNHLNFPGHQIDPGGQNHEQNNPNQGYNDNFNEGQPPGGPALIASVDPIRLATAMATAVVTAQPPRRFLPMPGSREAPIFVASKPKDLFRFLKRYEDLCQQCQITLDRRKIENISQYADAQTESEWQAFGSYKNGTWAEFRKELINSYPEAVGHEEGSMERLEIVCKNNMQIGIKDQTALWQMKREFMAEVTKLTRTNPPVLSNQSLVRLFFDCLDDNFRGSLIQRLQIQTTNAATTGRRRDDLYDLDFVIKLALEMVNGAAGQNLGRQLYSTSKDTQKSEYSQELTPIQAEVDGLRDDVAGMKDLITIGVQRQEAEHNQLMEELQKTMQATMSVEADPTEMGNCSANYFDSLFFHGDGDYDTIFQC